MSHIEIAASNGMRAGFNAYIPTLRKSGLPQAQAKLAEYEALPKRKRFSHYCATVGPDVTAYIASMKNKPRNVRAGEVVEDVLADKLAEARQRLAELEAEAAAAKSKPRERKPKSEVKTNLWRAWAVRKYEIPTTIGATFEYVSKKRGTTHTHKVVRVTSEGVETQRVS